MTEAALTNQTEIIKEKKVNGPEDGPKGKKR